MGACRKAAALRVTTRNNAARTLLRAKRNDEESWTRIARQQRNFVNPSIILLHEGTDHDHNTLRFVSSSMVIKFTMAADIQNLISVQDLNERLMVEFLSHLLFDDESRRLVMGAVKILTIERLNQEHQS